jgi:DNA-binding winged helix-turn-helix (wHTH) protein/Tol biopolymer transport system component
LSSEAATTSPPIPDPPAEHPAGDAIVMYEFGPFRVDVSGRHLLRDGNVVPLTAKVFDTLLVLVRNHDRPVMKEELIHAVWPGSFVSDDSLVQNISALRRALGDDSSQPRYIATLARRGYRFIAPTTAHTQGGDIKPPVTTEVHHDARDTPRVESAPAQRRLSLRWAVAAFAVGVAVTAAVATVARRAPAEATTSFRFQEPIPDGLILRGGAVLSPDGRQLAFTAQDDSGVSYVWVRALDAPEARLLPGTENAGGPFWSPDGKFIGFNSGGEIKRVGLDAGTVRVIVPTHRTRPLGVSWGTNDTVLYADLGKIFSVPASGGKGAVLLDSTSAGAQGELRYPQWLNDDKRFIFYAGGNSALEQNGTYLATLGSGKAALLLPGYRATYSPPNYLLYVRDRTLMAQRFNPESARLDGAPMALPGNVSPSADLSTSSHGVLTITQSHGNERLVWMDRQGKSLSQIALQRQFSDIALSPDNRQLLASVIDAGTWELWLIDLERQVSTKVANDGTFPAWAPDGTRFAYTLVTAAGADLYLKSLAGGSADVPFLKSDELKAVNSWSPDNRFIVFNKYNTREQTSRDIWLLPVDGDRKPIPFMQTKALERDARVSPDGRFIAYTSDETGTPEVYVQSFPSPGMKVQISTGGGEQPQWRADGREVYYLSSDRRLTAVSLSATLVPSQPQPLFRLAPVGATRQYAPSKDGQRFVVLDWDAQQVPSRVTVLTNWEALQKP